MTKIICLVNNFSINDSFSNEHGLSLYIETEKAKILFDTGLGKALFCNAKLLNIDLESLDYIVLSHSHNDHTGGLKELLKINVKAKVIAHKDIFAEKYSSSTGEYKFIGLTKENLDLNRFIFVEDKFCINEIINIYGNFNSYEDSREKNHFVKSGTEYLPDYASDEIYLIIEENGFDILITGCSHRGIINIVRELKEKNYFKNEFWIFGGLHTRNKSKEELENIIRELETLSAKKAFVNHCTFKDKVVNERQNLFEYFYAGDRISFGGK